MHPTFFDPFVRMEIASRVKQLRPETAARWGKMNAPRMVAHLTDQMHHALADVPTAPVEGLLRHPLVRRAAIYWMPWPRGRVQGPPEAFVTQPGSWSDDVQSLLQLVDRFGRKTPMSAFPEHALFGAMTGDDWGVFCCKHFDHHLRQFGV